MQRNIDNKVLFIELTITASYVSRQCLLHKSLNKAGIHESSDADYLNP
jgi:hypothetical protein